MPERTTPYPLPDRTMLSLSPRELAGIAVAIIQRVYGVTLDESRAGVTRLDALLRGRFRLGCYTPDTFPAALAVALGAHLGEVLLRAVPGGRWGEHIENLYGTPLPFLVFTLGEYERQINVVEDMLTLLWRGDGLLPGDYFADQVRGLTRLGFDTRTAA